jgi:TRAP-type mannitol/chloroaromatic compound transport system permease small subunit
MVALGQTKQKVIHVRQRIDIRWDRIGKVARLFVLVLSAFFGIVTLLNMSFIGWTQEKQNVFNWCVWMLLGAKAWKQAKPKAKNGK